MNLGHYFVGLLLILVLVAGVVNIEFVQTLITDAGYTVAEMFATTSVVLTIVLTAAFALGR